jgi:catalase
MGEARKTEKNDKERDLEANKVIPQPEMSSDQGIKVSDDRNSLKAGSRGPTLMEDFLFREKITHFDHERIPERVVHARGAAAHGHFQVYESLAEYTAAKFLQDPSVKTPVFLRFSTVAGSRGSADTARDVRGFATKFYTEEGNFDLVGNNIPVFFIQDAIKFPDLVHSVKPEPHNEIPQASSAHDTFYDFISLTPESMHMLMWIMSDRAIPRSYRMMEGFGVHSFKLVNSQGKVRFVKFHWKPVLGIHSLVWDEAVKLAGKDPDFHRRDLWEAIEGGDFPEWELGLQLIDEEDEQKFDFDVLDSTKIWPEDLIPVKIVGKMTLNRNPDNFFAETEQVAFHTGNIVPGIEFSNDPLLQGRLFSYLDTQLLRLGGPNFTQIPINRPITPVSNNFRDGLHQHRIIPGRVSYHPSSLEGNAPAEVSPAAGAFASYPERVEGTKLRERSASFSDHYGQARLFWNSMSVAEKQHISSALQFELAKVETREVRARMLEHLALINEVLANQVAAALGEKIQDGKAVQDDGTSLAPALADFSNAVSETSASGGLQRTSGLSTLEKPKFKVDNVKTRKVAVLVADGVSGEQVDAFKAGLKAAGAKAEVLASHLGSVISAEGKPVAVDKTFTTSGSVMYDAVFIPGAKSADALKKQGPIRYFIAEAYKHAKPVATVDEGADLIRLALFLEGISEPEAGKKAPANRDLGLIVGKGSDVKGLTKQLIAAFEQGRFFDRPQVEEMAV